MNYEIIHKIGVEEDGKNTGLTMQKVQGAITAFAMRGEKPSDIWMHRKQMEDLVGSPVPDITELCGMKVRVLDDGQQVNAKTDIATVTVENPERLLSVAIFCDQSPSK